MRSLWRLGISSVFQRRSRAMLLIAVVALSATLIAAVGVATGTLRSAIRERVEGMLGQADVRIRATGTGGSFDDGLLGEVRTWPEVARAAGSSTVPVTLRFVRPIWVEQEDGSFKRTTQDIRATTAAIGLTDGAAELTRGLELVEGRMPEGDDEIVLDQMLIERLSEKDNDVRLGMGGLSLLFAGRDGELSSEPMKGDKNGDNGPEFATGEQVQALNAGSRVAVGDRVEAIRARTAARTLRVVGIAAAPPLGGTPKAYMTAGGVGAASGREGRLSRIDIVLNEGVDAQGFVDARGAGLPKRAMAETTEKVTSGLDRNLRANQMGFAVASTMAFLAAAFIIMTGLSVGVTERQRELAVLRCIGAARWQLAVAQLIGGGALGACGAVIGVPTGAALAALMIRRYHDVLKADLVLEPVSILGAALGATLAGVIGAAWPAWQAARVSPLSALTVRAKRVKSSTLIVLAVVAVACILVHLSIFTLFGEGQHIFWSYVVVGLPALMIGYFLLGVPATIAVVFTLGGVIERVLGLPRHMLRRAVRATPYRFGFTSGAMMAGLALMVAIWTQGGAAVRDWLDRVEFPDGFVFGIAMNEQTRETLESLDFVTATSPLAMHPVEVDAFGIDGITKLQTFFFGFEPETFFEMTKLTWIQGDPATAQAALTKGGAVIVSREYLAAKGLGVGSTFVCRDNGVEHRFDIVGVVASPGLELVNDFFDFGEDVTAARVNAVFGNRSDLREKFGNDAINMIQLSLDPAVDDDEAIAKIRAALIGTGVINAGSGRQIKREILRFVHTTLTVFSLVAVFAMFVACLGVANLIVAGVQARQFEFGVLRAVGAGRGLLARIVLAEAACIAIAACVLGTMMGVQGAFGGLRLNKMMWGLELGLHPPIGPIALGWLAVFVFTIGAALPTAMVLARRRPRELLAAVRG
jgi:putative ABC transport system permease protein